MSNYFENKLIHNGITFQLTDKPAPDEREIHTYHEVLYFIDGEAELLTENSRLGLNNRSLLIIPKNSYHFIRLHKEKFLRLKISVSKNLEQSIPIADIMKNFQIIEHFSDGLAFVLNRLVRIMQDNSKGKTPFYAYAAFLMLIEEIDTRVEANNSKALEQLGMVPKIIQHISQNLAGDLSIHSLAHLMNVSASGIVHSFKNELGISIHKYITQRRLIYAREQILAGHKPSKIYLDCGYSDYSSFYRAYTKYFGLSPSKEKLEHA